jgi:octaprenyl-diphosphate synthase
MEQFYNLIGLDMLAVDAVIRQRLHSDVVLVRQVAEYIVQSGGKRLRPALVLLSAGALDYRGKHHHELAAVIEFIHTATFFMTMSSTLRICGVAAKPPTPCSVTRPAFWLATSCIRVPFQMMVAVNDMRIMRVLSDATNVIAEGEVLQLMNCHDAGVDEAGYLQVIRYKTAKLFEAAAQLGAIIGGGGESVVQTMATYGMHLGTAFQLIDDVLDYSGAELETGKHLGDDLAEGKPTLPLIFVLQNGNTEQAACVRRAIEAGGREDLPEVLAAIRATGALEYARQKARIEAERAAAALDEVPASQYKDSLLELCLFAVARNC